MENVYIGQRSSLLKYLIKYSRRKEVIQKIVGELVLFYFLVGFFCCCYCSFGCCPPHSSFFYVISHWCISNANVYISICLEYSIIFYYATFIREICTSTCLVLAGVFHFPCHMSKLVMTELIFLC